MVGKDAGGGDGHEGGRDHRRGPTSAWPCPRPWSVPVASCRLSGRLHGHAWVRLWPWARTVDGSSLAGPSQFPLAGALAGGQVLLSGARRRTMFERFTDRARRVIVLAQREARRLSHNYIGTEHILLGLVDEGEGVAAKALDSLGISLTAVRQQVEEIIGRGQ